MPLLVRSIIGAPNGASRPEHDDSHHRDGELRAPRWHPRGHDGDDDGGRQSRAANEHKKSPALAGLVRLSEGSARLGPGIGILSNKKIGLRIERNYPARSSPDCQSSQRACIDCLPDFCNGSVCCPSLLNAKSLFPELAYDGKVRHARIHRR